MHQHIINFVKLHKGNQTEKFSNGLQLRQQHGLQKEELIHLRANFDCSGTFGNASLRDASLCSISRLTGGERQMKEFSAVQQGEPAQKTEASTVLGFLLEVL